MNKPKQEALSAPLKIRPLISYAMSSKSVSEGANLFTALVPLFAPLAIENQGNLFDPKKFCALVESTYGLRMHNAVAENFVEPMTKAGLLTVTKDSAFARTYRYNYDGEAEKIGESYKIFEKDLEDIFNEYHTYLRSLNQLTQNIYTKEELESGLVEWLLGSNKSFSITDEYLDSPKTELHYAASRFLQHLEKTKPSLFQKLSSIYTGALVSELVLDYKAPSNPNTKARNLGIYLDAPFVMNLLNLSGSQHYQEAKIIYDQLAEIETQIYIFSHSCDEIRNSIQAVLSSQTPTGPLASAIQSREVLEQYARTIMNDVERHVKELNIKIFDPGKYGSVASRVNCFTQEHKDRLGARLTSWQNPYAKERDIESICTVMRWRNGTNERDLLKSKHLFITTNERLANIARKFCMEEGLLRSEHSPPAISLRTLSALLFLCLGSLEEKFSISRKQLLANCAKAAIVTPEMIKAFQDRLSILCPEHKDQISLILSEPKSMQMVLDFSWGNPEIITANNIEEILEKAKEEITAEQVSKHKDSIEKLNKKNRELSSNNEQLHKDIRHVANCLVRQTSKEINTAVIVAKLIIAAAAIIAIVSPFIWTGESILYKAAVSISGCILAAIEIYHVFFNRNQLKQLINKIKNSYLSHKLKRIGQSSPPAGTRPNWKNGVLEDIPSRKDLL